MVRRSSIDQVYNVNHYQILTILSEMGGLFTSTQGVLYAFCFYITYVNFQYSLIKDFYRYETSYPNENEFPKDLIDRIKEDLKLGEKTNLDAITKQIKIEATKAAD